MRTQTFLWLPVVRSASTDEIPQLRGTGTLDKFQCTFILGNRSMAVAGSGSENRFIFFVSMHNNAGHSQL